MNIQKLKEYLKKEIREILSEKGQPQIAPSKPQHEPDIMEPGTKPDVKPKRRTLAPPHESPDTKPKAGLKENEKEIIDKIATRFKKLNND